MKTESLYTKKHFPLFSIITITLNNYHGLKKTVKSLDNQTFTDFEWLVIDGESTDGTTEFLKKRRSATRTSKNPFRFISEKDNGLYDAMNKGIAQAHGHYLLFLNSGDFLANKKVLETLHPLCAKNPDFIYGDSLEYTDKMIKNGRKPVAKPANNHKNNHPNIHWGMFTHHQAMLYRRHIVRDTHLRYSMRFKIASDYDFTARFLRECKNIRYINTPICMFECGGISQQNAWLGRKEQYIIREELDMITLPYNLWILCVQTLAWILKPHAPWLYQFLKNRRKTTKRPKHC